jgi:hypothetical protein
MPLEQHLYALCFLLLWHINAAAYVYTSQRIAQETYSKSYEVRCMYI